MSRRDTENTEKCETNYRMNSQITQMSQSMGTTVPLSNVRNPGKSVDLVRSLIKQIMALDPKIRQYDVERGEILRMLVSFKGTWMKARTLLHALDDIGVSLSPEDLAYHLSYLADGGYVELRRRRDEPGWRSDRPPRPRRGCRRHRERAADQPRLVALLTARFRQIRG